ncbi:uncharacterized protein MELLADRAFT_102825 [Melampsora larici-populina 98AG31]|uniref:Secreted protein n=1 Tax=Melampsora larici-populina (strain 98AG31 / pathotype 3-4-7) TaxID=747676 RepID=F4R9I1_MELLP|nr:uncharacterized protein MELLADRAFT_102825 [Melampsora larici-populina 98AG31]EGG11148.1 hypothetical protein MELLADRAFT_102825 [Melampsora larici-populina 98AG31]
MFSRNRLLISLAFLIMMLHLVEQTAAVNKPKPNGRNKPDLSKVKSDYTLVCHKPNTLIKGHPACGCWNPTTNKDIPAKCSKEGILHCDKAAGYVKTCQPANPCGITKNKKGVKTSNRVYCANKSKPK